MKRIFLTVIISLFAQFIFAQSPKTSVAIFPFKSALPENRGRASQIQQFVVEILRKKSDIDLIDRSNDSALMKELDYQIREQSMASNNLVQQGKVLGANQMIIGTLSNINVEKKTTNGINSFTKKYETNTSYSASVNFALELIDVETGNILNQKSFDNSEGGGKFLGLNLGLGGGSGNSSDEAIQDAIRATKKSILTWVNQCYPPTIKILKIEDRDKKGFPQTILVLGVDESLSKGAKLNLNELEDLDIGGGKKVTRSKKVGELKITDKQGDITVCKVTDGEKTLESRMTDGSKLVILVK